MTEIVLEYNPIQVRAEIIIEGSEIAKTSNLYRYRNTPLEDWVDVLIPELVDYSNDDNIRIEIRSLQRYIDEINNAIRNYEKKHRHVDIEVIENPSTGYKGRLNKLSQIIEQLKESECGCTITDEYPLDVLVVSMADEEEYEDFLNDVFPDINVKSGQAILISNSEHEIDGFEAISYEINELEDRHIDTRVFIFPSLNECSNKYWRLLKEKVNGEGDYVLIAFLNSKPKKNDELLDYIAEQLEKKGKINKSRFVFISENTEDNLDYIQDEYGVKLTDMIDSDNSDEVIEKVKYYIQNVSYVRKIAELSKRLYKEFAVIQEGITREAEKNKCVAETDAIMIAYKSVVDSINNHYQSISGVINGSYSIYQATKDFIEILSQNILDMIEYDVMEALKKVSMEQRTEVYGSYSPEYKAVEECYTLYYQGRKANEVMKLTEMTLFDFLIDRLSSIISLEAIDESKISDEIVLQKKYAVYPLVRNRLEEFCRSKIIKIAAIVKRGDGRNKTFFEWVTGNISRGAFNLDSYMNGFGLSPTKHPYDKVDRWILDRNVRDRIQAIEKEITFIIENAFDEFGLNSIEASLIEKKNKIKSKTDDSIVRLEEHIKEELKKLDIRDEDKCRIANLDDIMSELEETINL